MTIGFDSSILTAWYASKAGITSSTGGSGTGSAATTKYAPTAPWNPGQQSTADVPALQTAAVQKAMTGGKLIDESAAKLDLVGASDDYKKLFALYQGLGTLSAIADQMKSKGLTTVDQNQIKKVFASGLAEIQSYTDSLQLSQARITRGQVGDSAKTTAAVPATALTGYTYTTPPLVSKDITAEVPALQGDVRFNISIKRAGTTHDIAIDLSQMGSTPRTLGNVVTYINDQLAASGVATRVATQRIPGGDRTVTVGGKPVTVGTNPDQWALKIKVDSGDTVTLSPVTTAPSVYVAQTVGDPNPDKDPTTNDGVTNSQLLKIQSDTSVVAAPVTPPGQATQVDGQVWSQNMESTVGTVHATQVGPDGSVYVLADVTGKVAGQALQGAQDVALMKYDSAGKLMYTRTLGAAGTATGLALSVSSTGQVAVAGKLTGTLAGATDGALNSGSNSSFAADTDSFVTLYDAQGNEAWTQRRGARLNDEANNVAFGSDGTVYVAGRSQSTMPGGSALGGWDSYLEGFKADASGKVSTVFTQTVGSAGSDKPGGLVVDGTSLVMADNEDGHAVLRRYDVSGGAPTLTASRDLGDLQGGSIAGLALNGTQVVIAGSTANGALSAGTVTSGASGGTDAFVAQVSSDLNPSVGDSLAYYGSSGNDTVSGLAVAGGQVYISGQAGGDLPGLTSSGTKKSFVAQIDVGTGTVGWSREFTGKDGYAVPTALAVDAGGASALDRFGLPTGLLGGDTSQQLSAVTSVRAGDQFQVRNGDNGAKTTVTIDLGETLDTLSTKITRALGFQASVKVSTTLGGTRALTIKPINDRDTLELFGGPKGKDALSLLGLPEGVIRNTTVDKNGAVVPSDGKGQIYGLALDDGLNLDTASAMSHVAAQLATAMGVIRQAYKDLQAAATPDSVKAAQKAATAAASGTVPAYLTAQIANYQAGLNKLLGNG
jgi:hypothetical protein